MIMFSGFVYFYKLLFPYTLIIISLFYIIKVSFKYNLKLILLYVGILVIVDLQKHKHNINLVLERLFTELLQYFLLNF